MDELFLLPKKVADGQFYRYRDEKTTIDIEPIYGDDRRKFVMDILCNDILKNSITCNHRYNNNIILRRLCMSGHRHKNPKKVPDDMPNSLKSLLAPYQRKRIDCPHIHILQNSRWGNWAVPADILIEDIYLNNTMVDTINNIKMFFDYCNIIGCVIDIPIECWTCANE